MYHYNKSKNFNRQTVTPKESHIFGPYFSVQPTSSSVLSKPNSADVRKDGHDSISGLTNSTAAMRRLAHPNNDVHNFGILPTDKYSPSPSHAGGFLKPRPSYPGVGAHMGDNSAYNIGADQHAILSGEESYRVQSARISPKHQKSQVIPPGDHVIFAESTSYPGLPIVYRTVEERMSNPDRLNLDRRKLTMCPMLEGEDQLRLLNYQHNYITRMVHLSNLRRLIFLDLYDNRIEEIDGLQMLRSLRVLMLGKNRIKKIENLHSLTKLDVLDLHGNEITQIENLSHLGELRVLNLAGNHIVRVNNLAGMVALAELNLRRNKIKTVNDVDHLPCLQRLFLSFNEITSYEDISCLSFSSSLSELSLDGNPLNNDSTYKCTILRNMQQIKLLDMRRVSEEERRLALVISRKEEEKKREMTKAALVKEKRSMAIRNAKRHWESSHVSPLPPSSARAPHMYAAQHVATVDNVHLSPVGDAESTSGGSRPATSQSALTGRTSSRGERPNSAKIETKEPIILNALAVTTSHLAELDNDTLNLYGPGSLEALDRSWGIQAAGAVTSICFSFIPFDELARHLYKIRARFPSVNTIKFYATNIDSLHQLNALAGLRRLDHVVIDPDGNPVTRFHLWRYYLVYRLAHFNIKRINDVEVRPVDVTNAESIFRPMAGVIGACLPTNRLFSLLSDTRRKQLLTASDEKTVKALENKMNESRSIERVTKSALSYAPVEEESPKKSQSSNDARREFASLYIKDLVSEAAHVNVKRTELQNVWPLVYHDMVKSAVLEIVGDRNSYVRKHCPDLGVRDGEG